MIILLDKEYIKQWKQSQSIMNSTVPCNANSKYLKWNTKATCRILVSSAKTDVMLGNLLSNSPDLLKRGHIEVTQ